MALWDQNLMVSEEQSIATSAGSATDSTNILDTEIANPNKGEGTPIYFKVFVDGGAVTGSSTSAGTLTVKVEDSDNNSTWYDLVVGEGLSYTSGGTELPNGTIVLQGALPNAHQRYLKITYNAATKAISSGKADAGFKLE